MEAIKLQDFIQRTLVEVAQGIKGANKEISNLVKNPEMNNLFHLDATSRDRRQGFIEFDVAVMASESDKDASGLIVFLASLGGGMKTERTLENELVHRIKFEVGLSTRWV